MLAIIYVYKLLLDTNANIVYFCSPLPSYCISTLCILFHFYYMFCLLVIIASILISITHTCCTAQCILLFCILHRVVILCCISCVNIHSCVLFITFQHTSCPLPFKHISQWNDHFSLNIFYLNHLLFPIVWPSKIFHCTFHLLNTACSRYACIQTQNTTLYRRRCYRRH